MLLDPSGRVYPSFVQTPEQRERWDSCTRVAVATWQRFEPGPPTGTWMLHTTSSLYFSDISTGTSTDTEHSSR
jgi:hypothetical protein